MDRISINPFSTLFCIILFVTLAACKKNDPPEPVDPGTENPASVYEAEGLIFMARLNAMKQLTYYTYPGYFLTVHDIRKVDGVMKVAWKIEEYLVAMPQGLATTHFGTIAGGIFNPQTFAPCWDASVNSNYKRILHHTISGQGHLFSSYRWRETTSQSMAWKHSFCSTTGVVSGGEYDDYPIAMAENNGMVTGIGGMIYNGLQVPFLKHYRFSGGVWQIEIMSGLRPEIQGYDYNVTTSGNEFLAYTTRTNSELGGEMNLAGFDGIGWSNLGNLPASNVRKIAGINIQTYYEPFRIKIIRNGETPWILMFRDDNTMVAYRFDGTKLRVVAEAVPFPSLQHENQIFCIYQDKLTTFGSPNNTGILDDQQTVYQLNGNAFTRLKNIGLADVSVTGVWSDNSRLWIACSVFNANNGFFYGPLDIVELKL